MAILDKEMKYPYLLIVLDHKTRAVHLIGLKNGSTAEVIRRTVEFMGQFGCKLMVKGIRADAGSQFLSREFLEWAQGQGIVVTIAAPRHQEMNSICETAWKIIQTMSRGYLIQAKLWEHFKLASIHYACRVLDILPCCIVVDDMGEPSTLFFLRNKRKPRFAKYKVFGCPAVIHKPEHSHQGQAITKNHQIQQGIRGTFIGFPPNQAGYQFYIEEPIKGSHLLVSQDAIFDEEFITAIACTEDVFHGGEKTRTVGTGYIPPLLVCSLVFR